MKVRTPLVLLVLAVFGACTPGGSAPPPGGGAATQTISRQSHAQRTSPDGVRTIRRLLSCGHDGARRQHDSLRQHRRRWCKPYRYAGARFPKCVSRRIAVRRVRVAAIGCSDIAAVDQRSDGFGYRFAANPRRQSRHVFVRLFLSLCKPHARCYRCAVDSWLSRSACVR